MFRFGMIAVLLVLVVPGLVLAGQSALPAIGEGLNLKVSLCYLDIHPVDGPLAEYGAAAVCEITNIAIDEDAEARLDPAQNALLAALRKQTKQVTVLAGAKAVQEAWRSFLGLAGTPQSGLVYSQAEVQVIPTSGPTGFQVIARHTDELIAPSICPSLTEMQTEPEEPFFGRNLVPDKSMPRIQARTEFRTIDCFYNLGPRGDICVFSSVSNSHARTLVMSENAARAGGLDRKSGAMVDWSADALGNRIVNRREGGPECIAVFHSPSGIGWEMVGGAIRGRRVFDDNGARKFLNRVIATGRFDIQ